MNHKHSKLVLNDMYINFVAERKLHLQRMSLYNTSINHLLKFIGGNPIKAAVIPAYMRRYLKLASVFIFTQYLVMFVYSIFLIVPIAGVLSDAGKANRFQI